MLHPVQKRLPHLFCLLCVQSVRNHADAERVVGIEMGLLSPMVVEEMVAIETHELADQALVGIIRRRSDREVGDTEEPGKIMKTQRQLTHHAKGPASAALQRPEQIGV